MSGNDCSPIPDDKLMAYIYDDVDDSDIFGFEQLNNSFTENDAKDNENIEPADNKTIQILQEKLEKVQREKELLELRISELVKTARAELERKDRRLLESEQERNNILFRRNNNALNKQRKHEPEKQLTNEEFQNFNTGYKIPKKILNENKEECQTIKRFGVLPDTTEEVPQSSRYNINQQDNRLAEENCKTPSKRGAFQNNRSRLRPRTPSGSPSMRESGSKSKENLKEFKPVVSRRKSVLVDDDREISKLVRRGRSKTVTEESCNTPSSKFADRPRRQTPPRSPPRERSPEHCRSVSNEKGLKTESREKLPPRERRKSRCVEKSPEPTHHIPSSKFADRPRRRLRTPPGSPPRKCSPEYCRSLSNEKGLKTESREKLPPRERRKSTCVEKSPEPAHHTPSSKFADRPRRPPRTPPGSPLRERSPEYCRSLSNEKGLKTESREKLPPRERRKSTCVEKSPEPAHHIPSSKFADRPRRRLRTPPGSPPRERSPEYCRSLSNKKCLETESREKLPPHERRKSTCVEKSPEPAHHTPSSKFADRPRRPPRTPPGSPLRERSPKYCRSVSNENGLKTESREKLPPRERRKSTCVEKSPEPAHHTTSSKFGDRPRRPPRTPPGSPRRERSPEHCRSVSNEKGLKTESREKIPPRERRKSTCVEKSPEPAHHTPSSKFAGRPRRSPKTPPGSPRRERSPEYCRSISNEKGLKAESREKVPPRERRKSTCVEKSPEGTLRLDNEENKNEQKNLPSKSPTRDTVKKGSQHKVTSNSKSTAYFGRSNYNSDKEKNSRDRNRKESDRRIKDTQSRDLRRPRSLSRERNYRGRDLRNKSRSRESSSKSYKSSWRSGNDRRDRKSSSSEHDRYNKHTIRPRYRDLQQRGRIYISRLRERVMRYSMERDPEALRHARKTCKDKKDDTDHSDLDDLRLHLSGASDEFSSVEGAKDAKDSSDDEFELVKHLGMHVDEMSDEDLERFILAKKEEHKAMCSEPERSNFVLTQMEEGELTEDDDEFVSCSSSFVSNQTEKHLQEKDHKDRDKLKTKSLKEEFSSANIPNERKIIKKESHSKSNKIVQSASIEQQIETKTEEVADKVAVKLSSPYDSIIEKIQEVKQEQLNFQLKHTEIPIKRPSSEAAKTLDVAMEAQATPRKDPRQDSSSKASFAEKKSPLEEKKPKKKIGLDSYKQRQKVEPVVTQAEKTVDNTDGQPKKDHALDADGLTAVSNAEQEPSASDVKISDDAKENKPYDNVVIEIPKSDYFLFDDNKSDVSPRFCPGIADTDEPMDRGTPCKDRNSFIHDFSMSEDEDRFPSDAPSIEGDSPESKPERKINILDVTILKPRNETPNKCSEEPQPQHQPQESSECIEQIQKAILTSSDAITKPVCNSSNKNSSTLGELQKWLEDDPNDPKHELKKSSSRKPKKNVKKKKQETKNKSKKQQEKNAASNERMLSLFGSPASSHCGSPSPDLKQLKKAKKTLLKDQANKPKKKIARSKSLDVALLRTFSERNDEDFEETQNEKQSKSVNETQLINYPVFFNHPSYIPNPQINQVFDTASQYISRKKDEYKKNLDKANKEIKAQEEKPKQKKGTKKIEKEHTDKKKSSFKIKLISASERAKKRKAMNDSIESATGKKKKLCNCSKDVIAEDCLECMTLDSKDSDVEEIIEHSAKIEEEELITYKINELVQKEINKITKPEQKRTPKRKTECTKKIENDPVETESPQRRGVRVRKQTSFYKEQITKKSPRRITPIKIGEVSTSKPCQSTQTTNDTCCEEKSGDFEGGYKTMQSPLPHIEKMLKTLEEKGSVDQPHENDSNPVIPEISLDTKDVENLGSFERDILENMSEYLGDKSLPSLHSEGKTNESQKNVKDGENQLNFSDFLNKNTNTSTPIKKAEPSSESANTLTQSQASVSNVTTSSNFIKSYFLAPLKRDRRRKVIVEWVDKT